MCNDSWACRPPLSIVHNQTPTLSTGMPLPQVQATFAGGLSEHLQAAGGANASVAASLRDSLAQMAAISDRLARDVAQGQRRLVEAAMDVRTGHTSAISRLPSLLSRLNLIFLPARPPA